MNVSTNFHSSLQYGEKVYLGEKGKLTVQKVVSNGIQVYGKHGFSFVYMGKPRVSSLGVYERAHKIKLIKKGR